MFPPQVRSLLDNCNPPGEILGRRPRLRPCLPCCRAHGGARQEEAAWGCGCGETMVVAVMVLCHVTDHCHQIDWLACSQFQKVLRLSSQVFWIMLCLLKTKNFHWHQNSDMLWWPLFINQGLPKKGVTNLCQKGAHLYLLWMALLICSQQSKIDSKYVF